MEMTHRLLPLFAAAFAAAGLNAQSWTKPAIPQTHDATPGDSVVLLNVEHGGFLCGANAWGTQASLTDEPLIFILNDTTATFADQTVECWTIMTASGPKAGKYVFNDNGTGSFIDMGSQGHNFWDIRKNDATGYYNIQTCAADDAYGRDANPNYDNNFYGWDGVAGGNIVVPNADPNGETTGGINWSILSPDEYPLYVAQKALYEALVQSEEYASVDASAAGAVYNNAAATIDEINAAAEELKAAIRQAQIYAVLDGATEDDPHDATALLVNPAFEDGNIKGWECTFKSGTNAQNVGYQSASYTNGDIQISKFIEAWTPAGNSYEGAVPGCIGNAELQQTLPQLPQGKYRLTADVIAVNQNDASKNPVTGVQLFATGGEVDNYTTVSSGNGAPEHFELEFISSGGDVVMGLRTRQCTANWIAADNFTLTYYGPVDVDPFKIVLDNAIQKYQETYDDLDNLAANADIKAAYQAALDAAQAATDEFKAAKEALDAAADALAQSVNDYKTMERAMQDIADKMEQMEGQFPDLSGQLADYRDGLQTQYEDYSATAELINGIAEHVSEMIATYISENCTPGTDVTVLLNNPGYKKDFSGWTVDKTGNTPGWGGVKQNPEGDLTGHEDLEEYKTTGLPSGNAEVYHAKFNISQVIKNMPRGMFTISCQAFERDDNGAGIEAEIYATLPDGSEQTQKVMDINADASDVQIYKYGQETPDGNDDLQNSDGKWIPDGMSSANWHFAAGYYKNIVKVIMTEPGDLTVGIRTASTGDWVLWDDFRVVYTGGGVAVFAEAIDDLIQKASTVNDEAEYNCTGAVDDLVAEAIAAGESAKEGDSEDACIEAIAQLKDAIAAAEASQKLVKELATQQDIYANYLVNNVESSETTFYDLLDEIAAKIEDNSFDSDEQVSQYLQDIKAGFTKFVQFDALETASEAAPADISAVIYNPTAVDPVTSENSANGWVRTIKGGAQNTNFNAFEQYNNDESDIHQTIFGLAPGYYRVKVQGFYRAGNAPAVADSVNSDTTVVNKYARLYAGATETYMKGILDGDSVYTAAYPETGMKVTIAGETRYLINSMEQFEQAAALFEDEEQTVPLYENILQFQVAADQQSVDLGIKRTGHIADDWLIFTNWRLEYVGTQAPAVDPSTAVESLEANTPALRTAIYNIAGERMNSLTKGVNIIKTTLADGTVRTQKVLVR